MALAIREREEGLQRRANRDELTGLLNRRGLLERLEALLSAARRRHDDELGLLFLDLDLFKQINDNLGHAAGDAVLRTVAERVSDRLRAGDLAGRMGGDEFVVVPGGLTALAAAIAVAGTILEAIEQPIRGGDFEITISASLGVTLARSQETLDDVMARADTAMYRAKQSGSRIVPIP
jgi:diguanylate cyclase (GGDEF)-like protein